MMNTFRTVDEALDFAMEGEQGAVDLYTRLAQEVPLGLRILNWFPF